MRKIFTPPKCGVFCTVHKKRTVRAEFVKNEDKLGQIRKNAEKLSNLSQTKNIRMRSI